MTSSVDELEVSLFRYLAGELPLNDFEQWVYSAPQLEDYLTGPLYLELISFQYHQPAAGYELSKLIRKQIDPARFHAWQIQRLLNRLLDGQQDAVEVFESLYKLYGKGYQFLGSIALQYVDGVDEIPRLSARQLWDENAFLRQRERLDEIIRPFKEEIEILLQGFNSGDLKLCNENEYVISAGLMQKITSARQARAKVFSQQAGPAKTGVNMGTYNILQAGITCPHCQASVNLEIEMRFGDTRMFEKFMVGDLYKWVPGGRPLNGDYDGEGYAECPDCRRDFFVRVSIHQDKIESVQPDPERAGYIQTSAPAGQIQPAAAPARGPKTGAPAVGKIYPNEKWHLTPEIEGYLEELVKFGVDISSTIDGDDYSLLAPRGLSRFQQAQVETIMHQLADQVNGELKYIDWYPHGVKFRIYPHKR